MKTIIIAIVACFLVGKAKCDESKLPKESQELVKRLRDWELERQIELQTEIEQKRAEVLAILRQQLPAVTKKGDLDGAIALRAVITELEKKEKMQTKSKLPDIAGTVWEYPSVVDGLATVVFENDGKLSISDKDGILIGRRIGSVTRMAL